MTPHFWNAIADRWDDEIFDTLRHDRDRVITSEIRRAARIGTVAADMGCGVGKYLPLLSRLFEDVHAFDQARRCVAIAKARMAKAAHVRVHCRRSVPRELTDRFDCVVCVNVAIHPNRKLRMNALRDAASLLSRRGRLLVVVPALESPHVLTAAEVRTPGLVTLDGVPTKHYSRTEIVRVMQACGLHVLRTRPVPYSWKSLGRVPPKGLKQRRPWDWLAVCGIE